MSTDLAPKYDPAAIEPEIAQRWTENRAFHATPSRLAASRDREGAGFPGRSSKDTSVETSGGGGPYCIVIPPPNVTAALHMGHALNNTLQDVLIRYHRMLGDNTVWIPGTDHAGIATQTVVDKRLQAEGKPALKDYKKLEAEGKPGREPFIEKVQGWADEYKKRITGQLKAMGCSCDWERERFTKDPVCEAAVREAFFRLFKDRLIYRGKRLVNWDPATQTALADDEVEMREVDGYFWYLRYPLVDDAGRDTGEFCTVATTRPETMLGDTAVAVNPKDEQRAPLIGRRCRLPIVNRVIPIIGDDYVVIPDPESDDPKARYASGFLKVTPAHDPNDWEIGQRHDLPVINVMAPDGSISDQHGWPPEDFKNADQDAVPLGLDRYEAREAIVDWFRQYKLLEEVKPYRHSVGHSYRSHVPIEPYLSDQWYVGVTKQIPSLPDTGHWPGTELPKNSLAGLALQAMADDAENPRNTSAASRDREGAGSPESLGSPEAPAAAPVTIAYLITFTTYGTWLHGDERGSIDDEQNIPGTPLVPENVQLKDHERQQLKHDPVTLDDNQRCCIRDTIQEVCRHRDWRLEACNVLTNHVHVVVGALDSPQHTPEKILNDFKAYATRRLTEAGLIEQGKTVWTRHGSTRYLKEDASVDAAKRYVLEQQGGDREAVATEHGLTGIETDAEKNPLPDGRGSSEGPAHDWAGRLRFFPARYANTFRVWHENIRDWCISRQLWWGHRIPVWHLSVDFSNLQTWQTLDQFGLDSAIDGDEPDIEIRLVDIQTGAELPNDFGRLARGEYTGKADLFACVLNDKYCSQLQEAGFVRDPDVLDTWFSSALWPFSTLGWPGDTPELATWNPGAVLCTAREIITLWVSRMVMFNLYFLHRLPFTDVFIHAMIQDGQGRKMSKSLGNGVDPLDIIHSHGSDAMRYTLAAMTTQTQDVRMPVAKDPDTGRNTSEKFDLGRNFSNKLWNAARFALMNLEIKDTDAVAFKLVPGSGHGVLGLAGRWILSRLARTVRDTNAALDQYEFSHYAQGLYDFFWRDLCDWYIEAIKPTVQSDPAQRQVLASCLDASLRMLHPVMPFITEKLWEHLNAIAPYRCDDVIDGVTLPRGDLLVTAAWPTIDEALIDDEAERALGLIQQVVGGLRQMRTTHQVGPRQRVTLSIQAPDDMAKELTTYRALIETLANVELAAAGPKVGKPADAAASLIEGASLYLHGLVDADAERTRLNKRLEEVNKSVAALNGRLANKAYVDKAPAHLVQQTRDQLDAAQQELAQLRQQLTAIP